MRRIVGVAVVAALAGAAMAQSFTIRTPVEGATVREMVKIKIPVGSIPDGSYIGVSVNGKFPEDLGAIRKIVSTLGARGRLKVTLIRDGRESPVVIPLGSKREGLVLAEDGF